MHFLSSSSWSKNSRYGGSWTLSVPVFLIISGLVNDILNSIYCNYKIMSQFEFEDDDESQGNYIPKT